MLDLAPKDDGSYYHCLLPPYLVNLACLIEVSLVLMLAIILPHKE
jgi:hypothetical protein